MKKLGPLLELVLLLVDILLSGTLFIPGTERVSFVGDGYGLASGIYIEAGGERDRAVDDQENTAHPPYGHAVCRPSRLRSF